MSSILDALNKLENEKDLAREQEELRPEDVDARAAADEMIGRDVLRDKVTMQVNPMMLIGGGLAFVVIVAVVVAVSVTMVLKPDDSPGNLASVPVVTPIVGVIGSELEEVAHVSPTLDSPPVEIVVEDIAVDDAAPVAESSVVTEEVPEVVVETVTAVDVPKAKPVSDGSAELAIAVAEPSNEVAITAAAVVVNEPIVVAEPVKVVVQEIVAAPVPVRPEINVLALPPISQGLLTKQGLGDFQINMVNPKSDRNPYGSAMINGVKVFEDGYIGGSLVRLKKVADGGVAVEISRTGELYFVKF